LYELAILGHASAGERETLTATLQDIVSHFGLNIGLDVLVHDSYSILNRDKRAAFAAVYFGGPFSLDQDILAKLLLASAPIIPTIRASDVFTLQIPEPLHFLNGHCRRLGDPLMTELAAVMLECVGLLRRQRRVFISYRRLESRGAALQMFDLLSGRGFDVFLDTHDIRPGDPFQDVLWHRLVDSDVVLMLDTPTYFDSRWTRQEIGRALAKDIQVVRVIWPAHKPNKLTDMAETLYLSEDQLHDVDGPLIESAAEAVVMMVERMRSKSIAARYLAITGKLRADVEKIGAVVEGVGAHRSVAIRLLNDQKVYAYPIVGVPTAETLNDVLSKARHAGHHGIPILVYDHVGIRDAWAAHLNWLNKQIQTVRAIKVSEVGWVLAAWEVAL